MKEQRQSYRENAFLVGNVKDDVIFIADLSDTGMKIISEKKLGRNKDEVLIEINVPSATKKNITINGLIIWTQEKNDHCQYGIKFLNLNDILDSINYIRELNSFISSVQQNFST